ncbi:ZIP family metal transporter [Candidatus Saccharibacteria bacterium]|nr:ZIP family metal transporter [Candidatus Saccharibacteria bacterium]
MTNITIVIIFSLIGGLFSLVGGVILLKNKKLAKLLADYGMPFSAGALLAAVFLDLLKDGLEQTSTQVVLSSALIGIFIFFFAERFLHWFHHHHQHDSHDPSSVLVIVGDTLHNALDGVAIAAAFLISIPTGIVTTIAIAAHEIPQEIGDFGLLLSKGIDSKKVLLINVVSSLATTFIAVLVYALGKNSSLPLGALLGASAGFLLYIALSDLIPTIHEKSNNKRLLELQPILMLFGAITVALSIQLTHNFLHQLEDHDTSTNNVRIDSNGIEHGEEGHDHSTMH